VAAESEALALQDRARQAVLLDPSRGELQAALRSNLLGAAGFDQLGRELAAEHGVPAAPSWATPFFPRMRENIAVLHEAHRAIAQQER
jgi:cyclic beta-1,2-glucan synthetase